MKARSLKPVSPVSSASLTSEVLFNESLWILESQKSLLLNQNFNQQCAQLGVIRDMNGILRCKGEDFATRLSQKQLNFPHGCHVITISQGS